MVSKEFYSEDCKEDHMQLIPNSSASGRSLAFQAYVQIG